MSQHNIRKGEKMHVEMHSSSHSVGNIAQYHRIRPHVCTSSGMGKGEGKKGGWGRGGKGAVRGKEN